MIELGTQQILWLDPDELSPNSWNPNSVGIEEMEKLKNSLKNNGFFKPVLYRTLADGTKEIIGGEHRIIAASELGVQIPTINIGEVDDVTAKKLTLMDNDSYGENDSTKLAKVLQDLESAGEAITEEMTYSEDQLADLLNMTVDVSLEELDELDDLDLTSPPEQEKPNDINDDSESIFKTFKMRVNIEDSEDFSDMVETMISELNIEESDPSIARAQVFMHLLKEATND